MAISLPAGHEITPSEWALILSYLQPLYVRKASDESVNNSSTLQNDNELILAVEASAVYEMQGLILYTAGTTEDFKMSWTGPTGAAMDWIVNAGQLSDTDQTTLATYTPLAIGDSGTGNGAGGSPMSANPYGLLRTSTTAGNLTMRWAQNTAGGGTSTVVKAGSIISLKRVA